jgi:hypothetical protein
VQVTFFARSVATGATMIEDEAQLLAGLRGGDAAEVTFAI